MSKEIELSKIRLVAGDCVSFNLSDNTMLIYRPGNHGRSFRRDGDDKHIVDASGTVPHTKDVVCLIAAGIAFSAGLRGYARLVDEHIPTNGGAHLITFELS